MLGRQIMNDGDRTLHMKTANNASIAKRITQEARIELATFANLKPVP